MKFSELTRADDVFVGLEPALCEGCGQVIEDWKREETPEPKYVYRKLCKAGLCVWVHCRNCDLAQSSFGPIDCPYCGSCPRRIPEVSRMRSLYRVKRRHW